MFSCITKRAFLFLLSLLIAVNIMGCKEKPAATIKTISENNSDEPAYGDALIVGSIGEPSNLIYMLASDSASMILPG